MNMVDWLNKNDGINIDIWLKNNVYVTLEDLEMIFKSDILEDYLIFFKITFKMAKNTHSGRLVIKVNNCIFMKKITGKSAKKQI